MIQVNIQTREKLIIIIIIMNWAQFKDPASQHVSSWHYGSILVSNIRVGRFEPFYCNDKFFGLNSLNSVITFSKNSIRNIRLIAGSGLRSESTNNNSKFAKRDN